MKKLEKLFYKCLWNGGPDGIKRTIVIKDLQEGALRMINAQYFIKALKITWLRKVIKNYESTTWYEFIKYRFSETFYASASIYKTTETNYS